MNSRTFHKRFTLADKCAITVAVLLAFYFFWIQKAIVGILLVIIIVGMIDKVLHTTYIIHRVKPIDRDEEMWFLTIDNGRFASKRHIPCDQIKNIERRPTPHRLSHYVLVEYGDNLSAGLMPQDEEALVKSINQAIACEESSEKL